MAVVPAEIEGPVSGRPVLANNAVTMRVVGVTVRVPRLTPDPDTGAPAPTPVRTPVRRITLEELAGAAAFDGRGPLPGFDGATAIVEGNYDTGTNVLTATAVEIEPAENLLLGALTSANPVRINGVEVRGIADPRMKFPGFTNEFGFRVQLVPALVGTPASAEGYFAGGVFFAHTVELDASAPVVAGQPPVSVTRARTRSRPPGPPTVDIRGGVDFSTFPGLNLFQVAIRRVETDPATGAETGDILIGLERAARDAAFPRFGLWRLQGPLVQPAEGVAAGEPFPLTAPRIVRVYPAQGGPPRPQDIAEAEADVRF